MNYEYFEDTNFFVELVKHVKFNIIRILQLSWQHCIEEIKKKQF